MLEAAITSKQNNMTLQVLEEKNNIVAEKSLHYSIVYATKVIEYYSSKDSLAFHFSLKGAFIVEILFPRKNIIIREGEFFIAKPNTVYTIKDYDNKLTSVISLHIKQDRFISEYESLLNITSSLYDFLNSPVEQFANPNFTNISKHEQQLFVNLLDIVSSKDLYQQLESEAFLALTFKYVLLLIDRNFQTNRLNLTTIEKMIKKYIKENTKTANITELARILNYSVAYTSELVTKTTGQSFKYLLREERVNQAKDLLLNELLSLEEIHLAVGYDNLSSFILAFKELTGETPAAYRNKHSLLKLN